MERTELEKQRQSKPPVVKLDAKLQPGRLEVVDLLRCFALLGILLTHVHAAFSGLHLLSEEQKAMLYSPIDNMAEQLTRLLFYNKARGIFSICFGISFYLQLQQAARYQTNFRKHFLLRMLVLFIFGLVHAWLLFEHEILRYYALLGVLLLSIYHKRSAFLFSAGIVFSMLIPIIFAFLPGKLEPYGFHIPNFVSSFGHFLIGFWAAKNRFFSTNVLKHSNWRRMLSWSLLLSVLLNGGRIIINLAVAKGMINADYIPDPVMKISEIGGANALIVFYISLIMLISKFPGNWKRLFTPAGRMTLTNYIMQSVMAAILFNAWGFNLKSRNSAFEATLLGCLLFLFQLVYSRWWLSRFKAGPLEWLWRSLYRLRLEPLLIKSKATGG